MALITCNFHSDVLGFGTAMTVILPEQTKSQIGMEHAVAGKKHPTLYLLHGLSDDDTIWLRRTSIERYVAGLGIAVVMPNVHRSFYADMAFGGQYWTFLTEELPRAARSFFPLSEHRAHNFVAGLSMGGYGAFKWALSYPEQFAAAGSLSGALDLAERQNKEFARDMFLAFGDQPISGTGNDLLELLKRNADKKDDLPVLYQCCGTEDFLYGDNVTFRSACEQAEIPLVYEEGPGAHNWAYWDAQIQRFLQMLPLQQG